MSKIFCFLKFFLYICTRTFMNKDIINMNDVPDGTKFEGIKSVWDSETIIKLNGSEICYTTINDGIERCETYKLLKNEYGYYYFITNNKSVLFITTKYYKQIK